MTMLKKLEAIYIGYEEAVAAVYRNAKPADGLFGWGEDPQKDPCHMDFYEAVGKWSEDLLAAQPDRETVFRVVKFLLETPEKYRESHCFWFMFAAQGFSRKLIPLLGKEQCAALLAYYDGAYPRRERLPVQKEIYKLLKRSAK